MTKRYGWIKLINMLLILVLLLAAVPQNVIAETVVDDLEGQLEATSIEPADDIGMTTADITELIDRRERNIKHFQMPDGSVKMIVYGSDVHRKNAAGTWQNIDNRLTLSAGILGSRYTTSDARVSFARDLIDDDEQSLVTLQEDDYILSMTPIVMGGVSILGETGVKYNRTVTAVVQNGTVIEQTSWSTIDEATRLPDDSIVTYTDIVADVDLEYVLQGDDIKENIIVKESGGTYTYSFLLKTKGLGALLAGGAVILTDTETGNEVYTIPAPYMYDMEGKRSEDVSYELSVLAEDLYCLTVQADRNWIEARDRAFPVTIDPTITVNSGRDTYINSGNPDGNYGSVTPLYVDPYRTPMFWFNVSSIPSDSTIMSASLHVAYYHIDSVTGGTMTVGAYMVERGWSESSVTWNKANQYNNLGISTTMLSSAITSGATGAYYRSPQFVIFDVKAAVSAWINGTTNNGIALRRVGGTNGGSMLESREGRTSYRPFVTITYSEVPLTSGVYRIRNALSSKYLSSGESYVYPSQSGNTVNMSQLFKVVYLKTEGADRKNYYCIRPMLNSATGLTAASATATSCSVSTLPTSDAAVTSSGAMWELQRSGRSNMCTLRNKYCGNYLYMASEESLFVDLSPTAGHWYLEPYTGDAIDGVRMTNYQSSIERGTTYTFNAYMYSSTVGVNGPVRYSVRNRDGSVTDKAIIDATTGRLTAQKSGAIKVGVTYSGAPLTWWWNVDITPFYGCKPYYSVAENSAESRSMNCQEYAFWTHDTPWDWYTASQFTVICDTFSDSNGVLYGSEQVQGIKALLEENWLDHVFQGRWEEVTTANGGLDITLQNNQWLVAFRVGRHVDAYGRDIMDYHFWYRTDTGEWSNKHGYRGTGSELLGDDLPTTVGSAGWSDGFYDSDIIYYVLTEALS